MKMSVLDVDEKVLQQQELAIADVAVREGWSLVMTANNMDLLVDVEYTKEPYANVVRGHAKWCILAKALYFK